MHAIFVQRIRVSHMTSIHYAWGHFTAGDLEFDKCLLNDRFSERPPVC
jgi:hypothetical protein